MTPDVARAVAAQSAPAPARQDSTATDVIADRKVYDLQCSDLLTKIDAVLHGLETQPGSLGERAAEAHGVLHELCTRLVDNELAWPARRDSEAVAVLREMEWASLDDFDVPFCTICDRSQPEGHAADCRLAKILNPTGEA